MSLSPKPAHVHKRTDPFFCTFNRVDFSKLHQGLALVWKSNSKGKTLIVTVTKDGHFVRNDDKTGSCTPPAMSIPWRKLYGSSRSYQVTKAIIRNQQGLEEGARDTSMTRVSYCSGMKPRIPLRLLISPKRGGGQYFEGSTLIVPKPTWPLFFVQTYFAWLNL